MTQSAIAARLRAQLPFLLAGLFAMGWIVTRALIQSITIDEADTYVYFASGKIHNQWTPHSNNHVLNTVLIHLFTSLFGLNNFAMRLPAMIGAAFYITSAYRLCTLITARLALAWPLFVCLILNPFIMDYLVAARGYSLALGFLMTALLLVCRLFISDGFSEPAIYRQCAYISACLGISFTANFSFAFVDIYTFALFAVILIPAIETNWHRQPTGSNCLNDTASSPALASYRDSPLCCS